MRAARRLDARHARAAPRGTGCARARRRASSAGRGPGRRRSRADSGRASVRTDASERVPVGARQVDAADRAGEEQVAAEERAVGVERDVRRRVPGDRRRTRRRCPATLDRLAALEQVVGRVRAAGHADGRELRVALEPVALALGHVDRRAGALGEVGDAAEVVEVPVRDQDRRAARAAAGRARAGARPRRRRGRRRRPRARRASARTT